MANHPLDTDPEEEELYLRVKRYLFESYEPAADMKNGITMTTQEIFNRLQEHMPGDYYGTGDVSRWMVEGEFKTVDKGHLKLEWMLKKRV